MLAALALLAVMAVAVAAYFAHHRSRPAERFEADASGFRQVGYVHNAGKDFRAPLMGRVAPADGSMWQYYIATDGVRVDVRRGGVNCMAPGGCFEIQTDDEIQAPEIGQHVVANIYGSVDARASIAAMASREWGQDLTGIPPAIAFAS